MPVYRQSLGGACSIASLWAECPERSTAVRFDRVCSKSLISLTLLDVAARSNPGTLRPPEPVGGAGRRQMARDLSLLGRANFRQVQVRR